MSQTNAQDELDRLRRERHQLQIENQDLQIALLTSNEHGDLLQDHLYRLSTSLTAEVRERQAAEEKLQKLIEAGRRGKGDVEIMGQILIDQGARSAREGEKAPLDALTKRANR